MIVGKTKQELINKLYIVLESINNKQNIVDSIERRFENRNIVGSKIIHRLVPLESASIEIIYLLAMFLYEETNNESINPKKYFTDLEIQNLSQYKKLKKDKVELPLVLENVAELTPDKQWSTVVTLQEIISWHNSNLVHYNFETQRDPYLIKTEDGFVKTPNINQDSVDEMFDLMIEGLFFSNYITINILADGNDKIIYDAEKQKIIIQSGEIDILDGFHRCLAMLRVHNIKPDIKLKFGVRITNLTVPEANAFITQENKRNEINKRYLQTKDESNYANDIVNVINSSPKSDLRGKISYDIDLVRQGYAFTLTDYLSDTINVIYEDELKNRVKKDKLETYLIDFLSYVYGLKYDEFENLKQSRKTSFATNKNAFIFYLCISKVLYNKEDWKEELEKLLKKIDFDKNNPIWTQLKLNINIEKNKFNSKYFNKIIKYVENIKEC